MYLCTKKFKEMYANDKIGCPEDTPQSGCGWSGSPLDYTNPFDYTKGDFMRLADSIKQCWFDCKNIVHNVDALVEFANENDVWDDRVSSSRISLVYIIFVIVCIDNHSARLPAIENMGKFYSFVKGRCEDHYRQGTLNPYDMCLTVSREVWEIINPA